MSGASQLHMQSLVPINYKNTCCLQICHNVLFTTNYLCDTYKPFFNPYVGFMLFCFLLWLCVICFLCYTIVTYRVVLGSLCSNYCFFVCLWVGTDFLVPWHVLCLLPTVLLDRIPLVFYIFNCLLVSYYCYFVSVGCYRFYCSLCCVYC